MKITGQSVVTRDKEGGGVQTVASYLVDSSVCFGALPKHLFCSSL